jgi:hypothetical protein
MNKYEKYAKELSKAMNLMSRGDPVVALLLGQACKWY